MYCRADSARVLWEAQRKDTDARLVLHRRVVAPGVTFKALDALEGWVHHPEVRFGLQRRDVLFVSDVVDEYKYSGSARPAQALTDVTRAALDALNALCPGAGFNALLLNRYVGGTDHISWHGDDERELGAGSRVATWSFGAEREFQVREKESHLVVWKGVLPAASVCVMEGRDFQARYQHCVPMRARVSGVRISVTARRHTA